MRRFWNNVRSFFSTPEFDSRAKKISALPLASKKTEGAKGAKGALPFFLRAFNMVD